VLEHPADSKFWGDAQLLKPYDKVWPELLVGDRDTFGGFTVEVAQVEWNHVARKPTWLYIVGLDFGSFADLFATRPNPGRAPTHWCSGNRNNKAGGSVPPGIKVCSAQQRRRTPLAFASFLLEIAACSRRHRGNGAVGAAPLCAGSATGTSGAASVASTGASHSVTGVKAVTGSACAMCASTELIKQCGKCERCICSACHRYGCPVCNAPLYRPSRRSA
jgi:hypothetical protein